MPLLFGTILFAARRKGVPVSRTLVQSPTTGQQECTRHNTPQSGGVNPLCRSC